MKFISLVCLFLGLLSSSFGDIDFFECGFDDIPIAKIDVEKCLETPCRVARGETYTIYVHPDHFAANPADIVSVSARAVIRGATFPINAYVVTPCQSSGLCPRSRGPEPVFEIKVLVNPTLLRGPAPLIINATYLHHGQPKWKFCFEFDVDIC